MTLEQALEFFLTNCPNTFKPIAEEIQRLQKKEIEQDGQIIDSFMAQVEVYEMVDMIISSLTPEEPITTFISNRENSIGGDSMAVIYAELIGRGLKKLRDVPARIRKEVADLVIALGYMTEEEVAEELKYV